MAHNDSLGDRMKRNYEGISQTSLVRRMPVVIRLDGCHFHTYTRGMERPFDAKLVAAMQETMKYLCKEVQGCVLGYTQSDEISLLLVDYRELDSQPWFDNNVQKICSVSASLATGMFNKIMGSSKLAQFDSRCFNIPKEEVTNYFYWRQKDAMRNSIQSVGQSKFSPKQLHGKSLPEILGMLGELGMDYYMDFATELQRGSCCVKTDAGWEIDHEIPTFSGDGREYIERLFRFDERKDDDAV